MEKYLTTQNDVISFRNCPVLLPPNPNADFIFEDAQKVDVRTCTTYYNHPGEAVQPRLNIKNLKFDFMFLRDLQKILDVLKKRYDHITYITLRYDHNLRPYHIYDKSFYIFNGSYKYDSYDLLISRIPKGEQRIAFILDKGLEPVINDVDAQMAYIVLDVLKEKNLLAIKDNKIVWDEKKTDELVKTLQEFDLLEEPSLEEVRKKLNDAYADDLNL